MFFELFFLISKIICSDLKKNVFHDSNNTIHNKNKDEIKRHHPNVYKLTHKSRILDEIFSQIDIYVIDLKYIKEDLEYMYFDMLLQKNENMSDVIFNFFFGKNEKSDELIEPEEIFKKYDFLNEHQKKLYTHVKSHLLEFNVYSNLKFPIKEIENWIENVDNPDIRDVNEVKYRLKIYCEEFESLYNYLTKIDFDNTLFFHFNGISDYEMQVRSYLELCSELLENVKKCRLELANFGRELFQEDSYFTYSIKKIKETEVEVQCILS